MNAIVELRSETAAPAFTVIVATYNHSAYIDAALGSIFGQSFQDFEVVVVDDGSTDGSRAIIENWRDRYSARIRVFTHQGRTNRGLVETYKLALSKARGEFVAFLEPDDIWSTEFLARKHSAFRKWPHADVVFSKYRILREGPWGWEMAFRQLTLHVLTPHNTPFDNFSALLRMNNVATFSCFAVRRQSLATVPPVFSQRTVLLDWWTLLFLSARSDFVLDGGSHVVWRQRSASALRRQDFSALKDEVVALYRSSLALLIAREAELTEDRRHELFREARVQSVFAEFFLDPNWARFFRAVRLDPRRAMALAASHWINSKKHGSKKHGVASRQERAEQPAVVSESLDEHYS
jgi:glycosyltransferase involved in cell wall biosynthesis